MSEAERLKRLEVQAAETRKLLEILIERYNEHWHDVGNLPDYGDASWPPKQKFKVIEHK